MKDLNPMKVLSIALSFALGYVAYKMVAKMIGDQDEVEPMLSASGSFGKTPGVTKMNPENYCQVDSTNSASGVQHYPINSSACKKIAQCKDLGGTPVHTSLDNGGGLIECLGASLSSVVVGTDGRPFRKETRRRTF